MIRVLIILAVVVLLGCAAGQKLEGRINLFGPSPTAYVGMDTLNGQHLRLTGPLAEALRRDYQGQKVRLQGVQTKPAKGPGLPAEFEVRKILGHSSP